MMKALSIRQPWAHLIVNGIKDIENRTWSTRFRGEFLIHAGKRIDMEGVRFIHREFSIPLEIRRLKTGGILGMAELVDCVEWHESEWFEGPYGFLIQNAKVLEFRPLRGRLGFFEVDVDDSYEPVEDEWDSLYSGYLGPDDHDSDLYLDDIDPDEDEEV